MARALLSVALVFPLWACGARAPAVPPSDAAAAHGGETGRRAEQQEPKEARDRVISGLRIRASRAEPWRISPVLPERTSTVYCTFDVRGLPPGTRIAVLWRRGERELARTGHVSAVTTRSLSSQLGSDSPLGSGTYEVEVQVGGRAEATTTFRIAGRDAAEPEERTSEEPRVLGVTVASEECVPERSARARAPRRFAAPVATVYLCLEYEHLREGQTLELRWYRSSAPREPLSVTSYSPSGSGDLSASYSHDGPLPPGAYHVAVFLDDEEVARARFVVASD